MSRRLPRDPARRREPTLPCPTWSRLRARVQRRRLHRARVAKVVDTMPRSLGLRQRTPRRGLIAGRELTVGVSAISPCIIEIKPAKDSIISTTSIRSSSGRGGAAETPARQRSATNSPATCRIWPSRPRARSVSRPIARGFPADRGGGRLRLEINTIPA